MYVLVHGYNALMLGSTCIHVRICFNEFMYALCVCIWAGASMYALTLANTRICIFVNARTQVHTYMYALNVFMYGLVHLFTFRLLKVHACTYVLVIEASSCSNYVVQ